MAEFFFDFGLFAAKAFALFLLGGVLLAVVGALVARLFSHSRQFEPGQLEIVRVNERFESEREVIEEALVPAGAEKAFDKARRTEKKRKEKLARGAASSGAAIQRRRVFVLDFDGDLTASAVENLRRELTVVLSSARASDEVVVRLESGGGLVHSYGLGASQLERVKAHGVRLTVCVDRVAASGGYMMACVADRLLCAPFAVLGSIGVVAQLPNFHRLLKKHDVDVELFTAGQYKRTVTVFGENTEEGRAKFRNDLDETHALFKEFVAEQRPSVDIEKVSTGEIWLGRRALGVHLVDELITSDEYLATASQNAEVLEVKYRRKHSLQERVFSSLEAAVDRSLLRWWSRAVERTP